MSLFSSIQLANNALRANQIGLQVVGQNIANANTPGYIRAEVQLTPAPTQRLGNLLLGLGVQVQAVVQKVDKFLLERLRGSVSERAGAEVQEQAYLQLETLVGELSDTDLSTSLNSFFSSLSEVLNQPESTSVRNLAVLKGKSLTGDINRLVNRVDTLRIDLNDRVAQRANDVNRLLDQIAKLNIQISAAEGADVSASDAVGLRDARVNALSKLAELIDVKTQEQDSGTVSVFAGGDFLVLDGQFRAVKVSQSTDRGLVINELRIAESDAPVSATSGEIAGLIAARDGALGGFLDAINTFAGALAFEFNKLHSLGQGLTGYQSITSEASVDNTADALDAAGLRFTPTNGQFEIKVYNPTTGLSRTSVIRVDLNGLDGDTSLADLAAEIDAIAGVSASITPDNRLTIASESSDEQIAFAADTSGILAALGINTFFTGFDARSLGVNAAIAADPSKLAASRGGVGADTALAVDLAAFLDRPLDSQGGASLSSLYDKLVSDVTQGSTVAQSVAEGTRVFESTLNGQQLAISGVSIDEETVRMIEYQRAFQASAKYIATLSDLLELLVNL